ncbi:hypothetical protein ACOZ4F_08390 [Haloarcula marismortui]|nr:hypothetical protein [Haloarcula taiwanensis]
MGLKGAARSTFEAMQALTSNVEERGSAQRVAGVERAGAFWLFA